MFDDRETFEIGVLSQFDGRQLCFGSAVKLGEMAGHKTAQDLWGDTLDWTQIDQARFQRELDHIPPLEADLIESSIRGCRQQDLSEIFGISQAGISYRISRGIDRIKFAASLPEFTPDEFRRELDDHLSDLQIEMLVLFASNKNMTETARVLGQKQPKTRSLILDALAVMACEPDFARYAQFFAAIMRRIGHQVKREASSSKAARQRAERLRRVKSAVAQ